MSHYSDLDINASGREAGLLLSGKRSQEGKSVLSHFIHKVQPSGVRVIVQMEPFTVEFASRPLIDLELWQIKAGGS